MPLPKQLQVSHAFRDVVLNEHGVPVILVSDELPDKEISEIRDELIRRWNAGEATNA